MICKTEVPRKVRNSESGNKTSSGETEYHDLIDMFNDTSRYLDNIFTIDKPELKKIYSRYISSRSSVKASAHSFKRFTSRLLKLSFSLSMHHFLGWMSCLISFERCQSSCEEHGTSEHFKKILPTVGLEPQTSHGLKITSPPFSPLAWYEMELNVHAIYI